MDLGSNVGTLMFVCVGFGFNYVCNEWEKPLWAASLCEFWFYFVTNMANKNEVFMKWLYGMYIFLVYVVLTYNSAATKAIDIPFWYQPNDEDMVLLL